MIEEIKKLENNLKENFQTRSKYYSELQSVLYEIIKEELGFDLKNIYSNVFLCTMGLN